MAEVKQIKLKFGDPESIALRDKDIREWCREHIHCPECNGKVTATVHWSTGLVSLGCNAVACAWTDRREVP